MKKYFLIIALLSFVFLGLGNYSFAIGGACSNSANLFCPAGESCMQPNQSNLGTCIASPPSNNNTSAVLCSSINPCPSTLQVCVGGQCITDPSIATADCSACTKMSTSDQLAQGCLAIENQKQCSDGLYCCPQAIGATCYPPHGGTTNGIICSCPDGMKNVKGTCTPCDAPGVCCGISLNTSVPFIGNCIEDSKSNQGAGETNVTGETAFPVLMGSLTRILVTVILIVSFVLIIIGGIMIATGNMAGGKSMITKVVIGIALLGASGVILRLINPNFFG